MRDEVQIGPFTRTDASRPHRGRSVAGTVAPLASVMLQAVSNIVSKLPDQFRLDWLLDGSANDQLESTATSTRMAWALAVATLIQGLVTRRQIRISDALRALGDDEAARKIDTIDLNFAETLLSSVSASPYAADLFPYIMDIFGPTSRLDVIRNPSRVESRVSRKEVGSFYTPSDLADFMVSVIADEQPAESLWVDPACGSGIFLLAALRHAHRSDPGLDPVSFALTRLRGIDLDPQAADFAAFTLMRELLPAYTGRAVELWSRLRRNIIATDALSLGALPQENVLKNIFSDASRCVRLICNPPYTNIPKSAPTQGWVSLAGGPPTKPLYLPFVEMTWRLAGGPKDRACLVVPLAVATTRSEDHARCREALCESGGDWTMLFFDRQPHALFGEDAKTRAAVLVRRPGEFLTVRTSRMLKWTSAQRPSIFSEARATPLQSPSIRRLIPKLGSEGEAALYEALTSHYRLRSALRPKITRCKLSEIATLATECDVFVGGTAYNFLNIFRRYPHPKEIPMRLSDSPVHRLTFVDSFAATVATALLSSRVVFWLWHVECDGFHVPQWFLDDLPIFDLPYAEDVLAQLYSLSLAVWDGLQEDLLGSINGGKCTLTFRPTLVATERAQTDAIIAVAAGIQDDVRPTMDAFNTAVVSVDGSRRLAPTGSFEELLRKALK